MTPLDALPRPLRLATGAIVGLLRERLHPPPAARRVGRHPRSRCPSCGAPIAFYDNVPVVSWLLLRGRCRRCGAPISPRYPLVEALGAALFFLARRCSGGRRLAAAAARFSRRPA